MYIAFSKNTTSANILKKVQEVLLRTSSLDEALNQLLVNNEKLKISPKTSPLVASISMETRYEACMVLAATGDAMGYKNGKWEFLKDGSKIHVELALLGGIEKLKIEPKKFKVSDDTILHIATAEALVDWNEKDMDQLYKLFAKKYINAAKDM